jgi:hypothetical protein
MNHNYYYYFSTHTIYPQIYIRLAAHATSQKFDLETKDLLDKFLENFTKLNNEQISPLDYCSRFIMKHKDELYELDKLTDSTPKEFLLNFLGYRLQWKASTRSFGKNCKLKAHEISEQELVNEMTNPKASIKKLLDASGGDLSAVKPFLPAIMISLWTNTRDKSKMTYKHTGKFCFDFDKFTDKKEAIYWMKKVWSIKNINPFFGFISPRGKGFKIFCQVDISNPDFQKDFASEDKEVVRKHHKVWYEGAMKKIISQFPELKDRIDTGTNDPTRLTYIPFINNKATDFKYNVSRISDYSEIVESERKLEREAFLQKISENQVEVDRIMKEQNIACPEEAYSLLQKNKEYHFDLEFEKEKFIKVIDFIEEQTHKNSQIEDWVSQEFNNYASLQKLSWVLYGIFGDVAIEQIKRLIPEDSNKLDENHNDYRWAIRSENDYDQELLKSLTPALFYSKVRNLPSVNDFISENFGASSQNLSDFKILNDYYETYMRNKNLDDDEDNQADMNEFLDDITRYVDKKKVRLPLIEEFDNLVAEITLGPNDYLDKDVMHDLFQNKYSDKRIFFLRSQCGK